jgi:DNA/RNA-binding domain of Phe-tRNA-synthetase-like protein
VQLSDRIHPEIFELCPGYSWGKVLCWGLDSGRGAAEAQLHLMAAATVVREAADLRDIAGHPRISAWRDAFSAFGTRPSKFQSSVEALVRRARRGDELPLIHPLVGLYNAVSLRWLLPVGGDDLDSIEGGLHLPRAVGGETYRELGCGRDDPPSLGEVIYTDDAKVLCRRWCWRQGADSLISERSQAVVLNIHGLPPAVRQDVEGAAAELSELVPKLCGGESRWYVLDRNSPRAD